MTHREDWTRFSLVALCLLAGTCLTSGCQSWVDVPTPFATWIAESQAEHLKVVSDGTELELRDSKIFDEILSGTVDGTSVRVDLSCADISRVQAKQVHGSRTTGAISIGTLAAALVASILAGAAG